MCLSFEFELFESFAPFDEYCSNHSLHSMNVVRIIRSIRWTLLVAALLLIILLRPGAQVEFIILAEFAALANTLTAYLCVRPSALFLGAPALA